MDLLLIYYRLVIKPLLTPQPFAHNMGTLITFREGKAMQVEYVSAVLFT